MTGRYGEEQGDGVLGNLKLVMGLGCGKRLEKIGMLCKISLVVNDRRWVFLWKDKWCKSTPL